MKTLIAVLAAGFLFAGTANAKSNYQTWGPSGHPTTQAQQENQTLRAKQKKEQAELRASQRKAATARLVAKRQRQHELWLERHDAERKARVAKHEAWLKRHQPK